jgi:phospholipid/cholesterol/gamma-HCH transport system ATP-binding protein
MQVPQTIENTPLHQAVISVRGLYKAFENISVLNGIDLDLFKGENLVILGKSGTGKSVLIKIISGLLKPDKGMVKVLGEDICTVKGKALQELRLKIGFSFQNSALYDSMTVRENLEFALIRNRKNITRKEIDDAVSKVLNDVKLTSSINKMPSELSGGQTKRIGVARTLILHPQIMLYDEPTAGLDPVTSMEINRMINDVQKEYNTSSIIITHDLTCAKTTGNRLAILSEGKLIIQGSFEEVFESNNVLAKSFYDYNFISQK